MSSLLAANVAAQGAVVTKPAAASDYRSDSAEHLIRGQMLGLPVRRSMTALGVAGPNHPDWVDAPLRLRLRGL
jgi:hypothetical protein